MVNALGAIKLLQPSPVHFVVGLLLWPRGIITQATAYPVKVTAQNSPTAHCAVDACCKACCKVHEHLVGVSFEGPAPNTGYALKRSVYSS